jgi:hypothetical protein|tara:strand:+ start:7 stop:336 length:330 start_codon:yes stop_codon:yes gene_type:complete
MTTGISFTFEHEGTTYKYDGRRASNDEFKRCSNTSLLKFLGDLDGFAVNFTYDIEKDYMDFYDFGCDYACEYPEPYEDMNENDIEEIEVDYQCDLKGAFHEAFRKTLVK